jgi:hypothetical protein
MKMMHHAKLARDSLRLIYAAGARAPHVKFLQSDDIRLK